MEKISEFRARVLEFGKGLGKPLKVEIMSVGDIEEGEVFVHHNYFWKATYREGILMLFSDTDGFERWAKIDQDNIKGLVKVKK